MDMVKIKAIIESLLFAWGDPLDIKDISDILEIPIDKLEIAIKEMMTDFDDNKRGLRIVKMDNKYQIGTRPEHYDYIKKLNNSSSQKSLSNAALETLSIIAYRQPIIKSEIDNIRGVKCDRSLATLLEKQMIQEVGRLDRPGRPKIYGTTEIFLRSFALPSLDNLPNLEEIEKELERLNEK